MTPAARSARSRLGRVVVGLLVLLAAACGSPAGEPAATAPSAGSAAAFPVGPLAQQLAGEVSVDGAWVHLQALQRVADENGGNRAAGTPGYEASVEYVAGVLRSAGFAVSTPTVAAPTTTTAVRPAPVAT